MRGDDGGADLVQLVVQVEPGSIHIGDRALDPPESRERSS